MELTLNDILTEIAVIESYIEKFKYSDEKCSKDTCDELKEQLQQLIETHDKMRYEK